MDRAVGASRLVLAVRTFLKADFGIVQKLLAVLAQAIDIVMAGAIDAHHFAHGARFAIKVLLHRVELASA
jgi:hypothetical protein